ncbi:hypothetical protein BM536_007235 [Streptomyces phaeoluteigriseus]|uniref:Uncharacterized protein n=1 Tax=Streptomyces phaeoluteigriseus TaxID=114686 RepID=A0A1V6MWK7_9ACTN|nr:hypothetical protein [Streptomyces phaeoluteigriseus]OQD56762.1 hypothetical protein BM536_007235 [Streptomyces phaeoluteigriseus]
MKPPRLSGAFLRFKVKTTLIGMFLVLAASLFVHTVISPPRTDPPPFSPPPSAQNVWPEASLPPLILPTFTLPPPGRLTTPPLLPVK